jgi:uncharacterized membrane protein YccC
MHLIHPAQGYWILLTTLFVCQQTFGDTVSRMGQRIAGTALGVVAGWALLQLFPQPLVQSVIAVAAGVLFFATRATRYLLATAAMTLLVLMCFNQVGDSGLLLVPRLVDTAIGSAIAGLAVLLVLPHWQARRINELAATAMRSHAGYLRRIVEQYGTGPRDHLDYRLARRNDHNADAALSTAVSDMFREPGYVRPRAGIALRFLIRSHTLLSYLSALGAHRAALPDSPHMAVLREAAEGAARRSMRWPAGCRAVRSRARARHRTRRARGPRGRRGARQRCGDAGAAERTIHTELALVWLQIDALRTHAREWLQPGRRRGARHPGNLKHPTAWVGETTRKTPENTCKGPGGARRVKSRLHVTLVRRYCPHPHVVLLRPCRVRAGPDGRRTSRACGRRHAGLRNNQHVALRCLRERRHGPGGRTPLP